MAVGLVIYVEFESPCTVKLTGKYVSASGALYKVEHLCEEEVPIGVALETAQKRMADTLAEAIMRGEAP